MKESTSLLLIFLWIPIINSIQTNSYYLIELDKQLSSSSNESYCSNILTIEQTYRIPRQCQQHLLCNPYYCDDRSFRCMKIRETLCCLNRYLQSNCQKEDFKRIKDLFRSVYFQISIEHGYCEINLERIEKDDQMYCLANLEETTTTTTTTTTTMMTTTMTVFSSYRPIFKHFHRRTSTYQPNRYRHRVATRQNYSSLPDLEYLRRFTIVERNKSSKLLRNYLLIILLFSIL